MGRDIVLKISRPLVSLIYNLIQLPTLLGMILWCRSFLCSCVINMICTSLSHWRIPVFKKFRTISILHKQWLIMQIKTWKLRSNAFSFGQMFIKQHCKDRSYLTPRVFVPATIRHCSFYLGTRMYPQLPHDGDLNIVLMELWQVMPAREIDLLDCEW